MNLTIIPGIGGSGPQHWQSIWEKASPGAVRIAPLSWDEPVLDDWLRAIDAAVRVQGKGTVFVAHSLGCLAAVEWLARNPGGVAGALLVAVPDAEGPNFPAAASSFLHVQAARLGVPALMLVSQDDPYCPRETARMLAAGWGAELMDLGPLGHINDMSGLGSWENGWETLVTWLFPPPPGRGLSCGGVGVASG